MMMADASFKLTLVSPYPTLTELTNRLAPEYNCEVTTIEAVLDEARNLSVGEMAARPDVLLSRGGTASHLREAIQDIPVLSINTSALDLLAELQPFAAEVRHVVFPNYGQKLSGVREIARVLDIEIEETVYHSREELAGQVLLARLKKADLVIGGQLVVSEARKNDLPCVLLEAGEHSVREALREARDIAEMHRRLNRRNAWLNTILSNIAEGVIVTDEHDHIVVTNPTAERLLGVAADKAIGRPIGEIIPNSRAPAVRRSQQAEFGELLNVSGKMLVASRVPIASGDAVVGVVCTFAEGSRIQRAEQRLRGQLQQKGFVARHGFDDILTVSETMQAAKDIAAIYARGDATILVTGETGTGKELFAQAIHRASSYAAGPFVAINCAAIPETLLESELFGYDEGAFTGARRQGKAGLFEMAHKGTIFLDEIGEVTPALQVRLLRVLQERQIMRIGGNQMIPVDTRVICATNRDLGQYVREGRFRGDLFYRLNVLTINVPPLRSRVLDVPYICKRLLTDMLKEKPYDAVLEAILLPLATSYSWPGNFRELQNMMERLALVANLCPDWSWQRLVGQIWRPEVTGAEVASTGEMALRVAPEGGLKDMVRSVEEQIVRHYLAEHHNDQGRTAEALGISRMSLWRRLNGSSYH